MSGTMRQPVDPLNGFTSEQISHFLQHQHDPAFMRKWAAHTTVDDRMRMLEYLRWQVYGYEQATAPIQRVIEIVERD